MTDQAPEIPSKLNMPPEKIQDYKRRITDQKPAARSILDKLTRLGYTTPPNPVAENIAVINIAAGQVREKLKSEVESEIDVLTQIPNLRGFNRRMEEKAAGLQRLRQNGDTRTQLVLIALDANRLKLINDGVGGHKAGDAYLQKIASCLSENKRDEDLVARWKKDEEIVARWGGDEFYVLLEMEEDDQSSWVNRTNSYWQRMNQTFIDNNISMSAAAVLVDPNNIEWSKKKADEALYKAKDESRVMGTIDAEEKMINYFTINEENPSASTDKILVAEPA